MDLSDLDLYSLNTTGVPDYYNWSNYEYIEINYPAYENDATRDIIRKVTLALLSIFFILGIIGNGLVIWIAGFRMKKTISAVWFLHLAIADLLCCFSLFPIIILWTNILKIHFRDIIILLCEMMLVITMYTGVLLLTAMSIDRWVSVMWPFWAKIHRTQKRVRITAGIIWGMSLVWNGFLCLHTFVIPHINYDNNSIHTFHLIRLVLLYMIPFLIIFTSYVSIFLKFRKSNRPQRPQRPYRIITAVILCFFIFLAPYYIYPLIPFDYKVHGIKFYLSFIVPILIFMKNVINPIIYVIMGQGVGHDFLRSIPIRLESALSEAANDLGQEQENHDLVTTLAS
ncbi:hypothetical protein GDO81_021465 [Engystomops pustulosus]|uniref:G-protein coupled receptors family 1 profile domain-containing protein n=1 Tax=Engystomops pustulosus TaxID=76066 RepID=A0AAV6ZIY4_ENGPU|nr:hypothetical protein GDO81_021465 [Engystomops pustulosus]